MVTVCMARVVARTLVVGWTVGACCGWTGVAPESSVVWVATVGVDVGVAGREGAAPRPRARCSFMQEDDSSCLYR